MMKVEDKTKDLLVEELKALRMRVAELETREEERKRAEEELRGSRRELRNLSAHLQYAREKERAQIAREIHDELGTELAVLKLELSLLLENSSKGQEVSRNKLEPILNQVNVGIEAVKRISAGLRPALLDDFGLVAAIEWQVKEFQKLAGIECGLILHPGGIILDKELSIVVLRIAQEALTNIARHAKATKVTVDLKESANKLVLKVSDNGRGITKKETFHPDSLGILGMRERAHMLGGKVEILGVKDQGTTIMVSIPLKMEKLNAKNTYC